MTGYRLHGRDRLQDAILAWILALPERSVMNVYSGVPCSSSTSISLSVFTGDSRTRPARRWVDQVRVIVRDGLLL